MPKTNQTEYETRRLRHLADALADCLTRPQRAVLAATIRGNLPDPPSLDLVALVDRLERPDPTPAVG